jgi:hypothetical protein
MRVLSAVAVSIVLAAMGASCHAAAPTHLHIWFRAFIPKSHPSRPNYIRQIPGNPPRWVVPRPTIPWTDTSIPILFDTCFVTDNLTFSSDSVASARITSEAVINYDNGTVALEQAQGRPLHRADPSEEVDCDTGKTKKAATADTSNMHFGNPSSADGVVQIVLNAQAKNPLAPRFGTPTIDYGGTITWNVTKGTLQFRGYAGVFPAFEAYAALDNVKKEGQP